MTKHTKKHNKAYISFDFDNTLYNPETDSVNEEMKRIMEECIEDGYNVCITTLRSDKETNRIKELFPDVEVYPTGGYNKTIALKKYIPVPILKHYDDDLNICVSLKRWTTITPIWVRNKKLLNDMDKISHIDI